MTFFVRSFVERCCLNWPELLHSIYIFYTAYHNKFKQMHRIWATRGPGKTGKNELLASKVVVYCNPRWLEKGYHLFSSWWQLKHFLCSSRFLGR